MKITRTLKLEKTIKNEIKTEIHLPEVKNKDKIPVVVYLHSAGVRGKGCTEGIGKIVPKFVLNKCMLVEPVCDTQIWCPHSIAALIERLLASGEQTLNGKVYITGFSMGARGVWDTILRYEYLFSAGIAVSGVGCYLLVDKLNDDIPFMENKTMLFLVKNQ